jgi:hypothetical protein
MGFGFYDLGNGCSRIQSLENSGASSDFVINAMAAFIRSSLCSIDMFQWACGAENTTSKQFNSPNSQMVMAIQTKKAREALLLLSPSPIN